jgi:hypothetical protein
LSLIADFLVQIEQTKKLVKTCKVICNLKSGHLLYWLAWLQDVVVLARLWHKTQVLIVVVFVEICSDRVYLLKACLAVKLNEIVSF